MPSDPVETLAGIATGTPVRLARNAPIGLSADLRLRLAQFGLRPGATVTVLARTAGGGRMVGVGTGRVVVDHATAAQVPVEAP